MVTQIESVEEIKPIFKEYLNKIGHFYEIKDHESWCEVALKNLNRYLVENNRYIYIIKKSESIFGFALINKHLRFNNDGLAVAEFYIQKKYKTKGYGRMLAEYVFNQSPGSWECAVSLKNNSAQEFWKKVISLYTYGKYTVKRTYSFNGFGFVFNNA